MSRSVKSARGRRPLRALWRDQGGMAVVEFAFLATFMIFLYLGSVQLSDAIFANRKVTTTVRAVTDLTTQYSILTEQDLEAILDASGKVLAPYSTANAKIRISQIKIDDEGDATVSWSGAQGDGIEPLEAGESVDIPEDLAVPNTFLIYGEMNYEHHPMFQGYSFGTIELSDQIFMLPRVSSSVSLLVAQ